MSAYDLQLGQRISELRQGISQRELAKRMAQRGWKWTHTTVGAVEHGERPVRLSEAIDIAAILGTDVATIADQQSEVSDAEELRRLRRAMDQVRVISQQVILDRQSTLDVGAKVAAARAVPFPEARGAVSS